MHEMSVAQNIIDIVQQHLPDSNGNIHDVKTVNVTIGKMAGIVPESLEFSFQVIAAETPGMKEAILKMKLIPLIIRCRNCTLESTLEDPFFMCPGCGSVTVDTISGTELQVTEIEVDDSSKELP